MRGIYKMKNNGDIIYRGTPLKELSRDELYDFIADLLKCINHDTETKEVLYLDPDNIPEKEVITAYENPTKSKEIG